MFRHINSRRNHLAGRKIPLFVLILAVLALSGCSQSPYTPQLGKTENRTIVPPMQLYTGVSVENRPIMYFLLGRGPDVIFIIATIHGDEPAGTPLLKHLTDYLNENPDLLIGRRVIILPVANPDGLAAQKRFNANDVDLNRNFPADNRTEDKELGPSDLSEPESHIIYTLIHQYKPARIVSLHQVMDTGPEGMATLIPTGCIDYDGPGQMLAQHMAQYCDLPVEKVGARPGSLGSYVGVDLGIPIITFEMQKNDSNLSSEILWQKYGKALLAAIMFPNPAQ